MNVLRGAGWLARPSTFWHRSSSSRRISSTPELIPPAPSTQHPPPLPPLQTSTSQALDLLRSQPAHYAVIFLLGRRYLVQPDDLLTVPRIKDVSVGDVLSCTRICEVGSRDYTLRATAAPTDYDAGWETKPPAGSGGRGNDVELSAAKIRQVARPDRFVQGLRPAMPPTLDEGKVGAKLVVVEQTRGEWVTVIKKKRRKGYRKTLHGKPAYTRLRLVDITFPESA